MKKIVLLFSALTIMCTSCSEKMYIALSFDDGPNTVTTPKVLDVLEENGVKASFFVIGKNITPESAVVMQRAAKMGCTIENHSLTHQMMSFFDAETLRHEISTTDSLVESYVGRKPEYFRPPYINHNELMHQTIDKTFICGVGCNDWVSEVTAEERLESMLENIKDGDIFLLHDFVGNDNTVEALKSLIPEMKKRGFRFVTIPQLFKKKGIDVKPHDGQIYTHLEK